MSNDTTSSPITPTSPAAAGLQRPSGSTEPAPASVSVPVPVVREETPPLRRWLNWRFWSLAGLVVIAVAGGGLWHARQAVLPAGIVSSNGRVEAEEIDIETKFAGRVAETLVDEGDTVAAGQVLARMDTRDLQASLDKAKATMQQARHSLDEARADVVQQQTQVTLAQQEFDRTNTLAGRGYATHETLDQRRQALAAANAALTAANARAGAADQSLAAASHDVNLYGINIADNTLVSPREGRIQYRISNVGEVLGVGGKVFTLLDTSDVYMDVYLPTAEAGKARVGSDARIVLDAYPNFAVPAHVSFIATQAQFTPKAVETKSERDKLMFRVKVRVDSSFLKAHAGEVRTGLPGVAYVKVDAGTPWPAFLQGPAAP